MTWLGRRGARRRAERELDAEMRAHVAERVDDLIESGLSEADARHQAWREFGNVTHHAEEGRDVWTSAFSRGLSTVKDDTKLAGRRLWARPMASAGAVVTLACSVAAAAATWSLLSSVLLHPLPVRDPGTLAVLSLQYRSQTVNYQLYPLYPAVRSAGVFDGLAAGGSWTELVEANGAVAPRSIFFASRDFFDTLGVKLSLGRGFGPDDDRRGAPLTGVLSDRLWQTAFGGDPTVLGRQVAVAGKPVVIIGVTPARFRGLDLAQAPDLYMPLETIGDAAPSLHNPFAEEPSTNFSPTSWVKIVGRLPLGMSSVVATDRLNGMNLNEVHGEPIVLTDLNTASIPEAARTDMARFTRLLGAAVLLLLLIGCLSVGMVLLIRTEARRGEFAMCLALGATRFRLARGVALEGALLSAAGALLALPLSQTLFAGVRAFQLPGRISLDLLDLSIDGRVLSAALASAVGATLLIALVAGTFGFSADVANALRSRAGATPRLTRRRTRAALVIAQVAVAMVLVVGAGLFARSLIRALSLNPGYDTSHLLTGTISLGRYGYDTDRATEYFTRLRDILITRPGVSSVSLTASRGGMGPGGQLVFDGERRRVPSYTGLVDIDDRYFPTMGLRLTQGRNFSADDVGGHPLVAIVSESLGRFIADTGSPIGHRIAEPFNAPGKPPNTMEIVGVVPDVIRQVATLQPLVIYRSLAQVPVDTSRIVVLRVAAGADAAARDVAATMTALDPRVAPASFRTIDAELLDQMAPQHFGMLVLAALGVIAVLLTILGTAVVSESTALVRKREMSIRAALGATGPQLGGLVLTETLRLVGSGLAVGLVLSWLGAGTIRGFLFQIEPLDPATLAVVTASILLVALGVSLIPAVRVARVDLARVLREE